MTYHHSMGQLNPANLFGQQFTQAPSSTAPTDWRTPIVAAADRHLRAVAAARAKMLDWVRSPGGALALSNATNWLNSARTKTLEQLRLQAAFWAPIQPLSMPASRYSAIAERDAVVSSQAAAKASVQPATRSVSFSLQATKSAPTQISAQTQITQTPTKIEPPPPQSSVQNEPIKTPADTSKVDTGSQGGNVLSTMCPEGGALGPPPPGFEYRFTQDPRGCPTATLVPVQMPDMPQLPAPPSFTDILPTIPANVSDWRKNIARIIATTLGSLFSQGGPVMEAAQGLRSGFEDLAAAIQAAFYGLIDPGVSDEQVARGIVAASDKYKSAKSSIPSVVTQFADPVADEILKSIPDNLKGSVQQPATMLPQAQQGGGLPWTWIIVGGAVVVGGYFLMSGKKSSSVTANRRRKRRGH